MNQKLHTTILQALVITLLAAAFFGLGWAFGFNRGPRSASAFPGQATQVQSDAAVNRQLIQAIVREELQRLSNGASQDAKISSLVSQLQTIRNQLELYQVQHTGNYPTFAQIQNNWSIFTKKTDVHGQFTAKAEYGPYLQQPPVNPFTNRSTVTNSEKPSADFGWFYNEKTGEIRAVVPADFDTAANGPGPVSGSFPDFIRAKS